MLDYFQNNGNFENGFGGVGVASFSFFVGIGSVYEFQGVFETRREARRNFQPS